MKTRKTRIKKTTKASGSVQYTAEYKWGFWWYQFNDMMAPIGEPRSICYDWITRKGTGNFNHSQQEAQDLIDFYIARVKHVNACLIENEVVKVECERYP
jgi:hypothetical protein